MFRNKTARQHDFAMLPLSDTPRSKFPLRQTKKLAFNASLLIPMMCEEVLPGDVWQHTESIMARFATPYAPAIDDVDLETFYFYVPNRIAGKWSLNEDYNDRDWERFITGEDTTTPPPTVAPPNGGAPPWPVPLNSVADFLGIPPADYTAQLELNAFPFWAYFNIYNEWFRDQNLQDPWEYTQGDWDQFTNGTDNWDGMPLRANKRHDYFTASLPWPQKGAAVMLPLGTTAPVISDPAASGTPLFNAASAAAITLVAGTPQDADRIRASQPQIGATTNLSWNTTALLADLTNATSATLNQLRLAATTQQLLEKDARGGTRYIENLLVHFGIRSSNRSLQRPEYLGGSKLAVNVNPVAQTADYEVTPTLQSPIGNLGAEMNAHGSNRTFTYAAEEHGFIIGLCVVRATPTYQQGLRRHWLHRRTRLDYYWPTFANIGEQAVFTDEIYLPLDTTPAVATWGYQERGGEYRYTPNEIHGVLRSTAPQPLDWWHYAENFGSEPALNEDFITDKTQETLARSQVAYPTAQWSAQIIMDILHSSQVARLMPTYGVPGITRF